MRADGRRLGQRATSPARSRSARCARPPRATTRAGAPGRRRRRCGRAARRSTSPRWTAPPTWRIYRAGIAAAARATRATGLLVSMHGQGLYEGRWASTPARRRRAPTPAGGQEFLAEQDGAAGATCAARARRGGRARRLGVGGLPAGRSLGRPQPVPHLARPARRAAAARCRRFRGRSGDPGVDLRMSPDGPDGLHPAMPWPFSAPRWRCRCAPGASRTAPTRRRPRDARRRLAPRVGSAARLGAAGATRAAGRTRGPISPPGT